MEAPWDDEGLPCHLVEIEIVWQSLLGPSSMLPLLDHDDESHFLSKL